MESPKVCEGSDKLAKSEKDQNLETRGTEAQKEPEPKSIIGFMRDLIKRIMGPGLKDGTSYFVKLQRPPTG